MSSLPGFMLTVDLFPFHRKKATLLPSFQYSSSTLITLYSFPVQVFLYSTNRAKLMTKKKLCINGDGDSVSGGVLALYVLGSVPRGGAWDVKCLRLSVCSDK